MMGLDIMNEWGTPLIVECNFPSFDDYIKSLNKTGLKNYKYVKKHNQDLTYHAVTFHKPDIEHFMDVWGRQTIHGNESVGWAFGIGHVQTLNEKGVLRCFEACRGEEKIAMHFVEYHDGYVECHPPMYDKSVLNVKRYLAKYMWFNLIRYAIENGWKFLDLGSGDRGTWRELLENRHKYPRIKYKWLYIPKHIKDNPHLQPNYVIYNYDGNKGIREIDKLPS